MGFKEDATFARYLSIGVYAADMITQDLESNFGHNIVELERYAKANKVWQTKVKRMRLPDLLCVSCGRRFESKGKTKLEVKLSDSETAGRAWYDGGMRGGDVFAFARVDMTPQPPMVGSPLYVTRDSLQEALQSSKKGVRKSASEGSEIDRTWPMWAPAYPGRVTEVITDEERRVVRIEYDEADKRPYSYVNGTKWEDFYTAAAGTTFPSDFPVATSFKLAEDLHCPGETWDWAASISSDDEEERFPAVKAARFRDPHLVATELRTIAANTTNDWRLRLEAWASLSVLAPDAIDAMRQLALTSEHPDQAIESVFALSELNSDEAVEALDYIADAKQTALEEVRAAAVWGLGTGANPQPSKVLPFVLDTCPRVAAHAAVALPASLPDSDAAYLVEWLQSGDSKRTAAAAHLLAERGRVEELVAAIGTVDEGTDRLILLALGDIARLEVAAHLDRLDEKSRASLEVLWARHQDWLRDPETDEALSALRTQLLRK